MTHERLGATPHADGSCSFLVWAPHARRLTLVLRAADGTHERDVAFDQPDERGYHALRVPGVVVGARYALRIDDDPLELPDPASASQPDGVHAASQVVDLASAEVDVSHTSPPQEAESATPPGIGGGDRGGGGGSGGGAASGWRGRPLREYVIYELHVGTFTPEGTFAAAAARLGELAADGITAVELMPVAEFPGGRNWGYDGVCLFAAQSTYGGPHGLRRFVDAAHEHGICVVLDVVYNHLGPEGNYLARFGPYFSERHHTPWGAGVNVDGPGSDEVRRCFTDNALQWTRDVGIDALRLDAVHGIVDTTARTFLAELTDAVHADAAARGRLVHVIAESDLNDVRTTTPCSDGGHGFDSQWSDDFHHALHVALTGETRGYYADYAGGLEQLAQALRAGFVYTGQRSRHRGRRFGSDASGLAGERFVVYAQNHDQVGNRLLGDRLAAGLAPELLRVALAAVLLSPFVPMLWMGEEYGETRPFPYFTSHGDAALIAAVRRGRRDEFAHFGFAGEAPDPQGEETFRSAVLDWDARASGPGAEQLAWTRALLRLRAAAPSVLHMRPDEADVQLDPERRLLTIERSHEDDHTLVALNLGDAPVPAQASPWTRVLDSADPAFGGPGSDTTTIAPRSAVVFTRAGDVRTDR